MKLSTAPSRLLSTTAAESLGENKLITIRHTKTLYMAVDLPDGTVVDQPAPFAFETKLEIDPSEMIVFNHSVGMPVDPDVAPTDAQEEGAPAA